jgi:NAD(P)-dependent dehydrogenase (short-subunit alcohol dehydrogenase family)
LTPLQHDIPRMAAQVRYLPEPDYTDLNLPEGSVCVVTDDGTELTAQVADRLRDDGVNVVVLGMPSALVPKQSQLTEGTARVTLQDESEASIEAALSSIAQSYGPVAAYVHLNPPAHGLNGSFFATQEKALLKIAFLMAKHLKPSLVEATQQGDAAFVAVARLDGKLGASDNGAVYGAIAGGLFGLVKSLNLEWPQVFCRAVDLSADLGAADAADKLLAELHDPNRLLVEVGVSAEGRHTLAVMEPV